MVWVRSAIVLTLCCWVAALVPGTAHARDIVTTSFDAPSVDLVGVLEHIQGVEDEIIVEVPGSDGSRQGAMTITAKGPGPLHRWVVFTLHNEEPLPRDFILVARWPGYVGSGVLWPDYGGLQVLSVQASPGLQPRRLEEPHADAFAMRLSPGETVTYALELAGQNLHNLSLWQRAAFDDQQKQLSFFRGVVLGIATLTAVFMLCLFIVRMQLAFPAAALFAFSAVAFIAVEFGYLPLLSPLLPNVAGLEPRVRAVVEALMAAGALACLLTFIDLRRRAPSVGYPILGVFIACLGLAVYAWFSPAIASGLARLILLVTAFGGFGVIFFYWQRGVIRAQASLVTWSFLLIWTLCSFAAALGWIGLDVVAPILAWGLVLVLLTMAFTLTQFAFNQGVINARFFEDSGRRALALAGAEQTVWDWNEEQDALFVGPELERALGHAQGRITRGGLKAWLELVHPADRSAYVASVEAAVQRGRGTFSQDFRLRRGDGTYRWYQLKARAMPGDQGRASRCIGTLVDITAAKRSEEQLLFDAVRDRITALPNRALFADRLERAMRRADSENNDSLYVLVVDLDRFKHVNDGLGFAVGDSLLLTLARRLASLIGPDDSLARLTGDQFGIILNASRPERQIEAYVEQLRRIIAKPIPLKPREIFLTASIGVARYRLDGIRPEDQLKDAEIALYEAKRQGKDGFVLFRPAMRDSRPQLIALEQDLQRALERNQIEIAYQPVMRLSDGELAGFEALVRWRHDSYGLLEPDAFIGLAEETGFIMELGRFVLNDAARQLGIWQRAYRPDDPLFMTVNVSSQELINRDLIDEVKVILSREDLVPGSLKLELTETVLMENPELSVLVLQRLQQLGVGIACDDFGTGYSALSHLRRLPFDTIKIDRCFLEGETEDEAAEIILETIVLLAHDLGMDVVVEGIESIEQAERLRDLGCDFGQGFYFGEPLSARQIVDSLSGSRAIAGRATREGRGAFGFWQRLMGRGEEAGRRAPEPRPADMVDEDIAMPPPAPPPAVRPPARELQPLQREEREEPERAPILAPPPAPPPAVHVRKEKPEPVAAEAQIAEPRPALSPAAEEARQSAGAIDLGLPKEEVASGDARRPGFAVSLWSRSRQPSPEPTDRAAEGPLAAGSERHSPMKKEPEEPSATRSPPVRPVRAWAGLSEEEPAREPLAESAQPTLVWPPAPPEPARPSPSKHRGTDEDGAASPGMRRRDPEPRDKPVAEEESPAAKPAEPEKASEPGPSARQKAAPAPEETKPESAPEPDRPADRSEEASAKSSPAEPEKASKEDAEAKAPKVKAASDAAPSAKGRRKAALPQSADTGEAEKVPATPPADDDGAGAGTKAAVAAKPRPSAQRAASGNGAAVEGADAAAGPADAKSKRTARAKDGAGKGAAANEADEGKADQPPKRSAKAGSAASRPNPPLRRLLKRARPPSQ